MGVESCVDEVKIEKAPRLSPDPTTSRGNFAKGAQRSLPVPRRGSSLLSSSSRLHRLYQFSSVVNLNLPLTLTLPSAGILMPNLRPLHSKENKLTSNIRSDKFPPTEVQELPMTVRNRMKQAL